MVTNYVPDRGDAIWINFNPQVGHQQAGRRPAFILSPSAYNGKVGLAVVCPITSHIKGYPFEVLLPDGSQIRGAVLADQVRSLDWKAREVELIAHLPDQVTHAVLVKILALLTPRY